MSGSQDEINQLLAQFGDKATALQKLFEHARSPLNDEITKLRQENADLELQLQSVKNNGKFTLKTTQRAKKPTPTPASSSKTAAYTY